MKVELNNAEVALIINGLRALQENLASENSWLNNQEICESNRRLVNEIDSLCERLNFCG